MANANEKLMRAYLDCWARDDVEGATEFWADDVVLHAYGRGPFSGTYRGKEAYRGYVKRLWDFTERSGGKAVMTKVYGNLADESHAVNIIRVRYERPGKEPVELDRVTVFSLRDGKIIEERVFDDDQYALDEFLS